MTTVLLAPLYAPALLAKQLASLDALSEGRLTVGLGVGAREDDFKAVGASFHNRGKRFDAQLEIMHRVWSGQPLNEDIAAIGPRPVQPEGPEILIGGNSPAALRRLGRWGNGYIAGTTPVERTNQLYRSAEHVWQEAGRAGKPRLLACAYVALGPKAAERTREAILHYYAFSGPLARLVVDNALSANALAIQETIERFQQIGTDELILFLGIPEVEQVRRLADLIGRLSL